MPANPPFVIHVSEMPDLPDAVYIGRENGRKRLKRSKWHNPYKVEEFGRSAALRHYGTLSYHNVKDGTLNINELTGKPLACWCRKSDEERTDDNACHGDVLVELWKEEHNHADPQ